MAVLIGKKSLRRFPFFASYASFTLFSSGVIYLLQGVSKSPFLFYLSWSFEGIGVILGFAVVYEVFEWLLRPYPALRRIALLVFQWSVIALVLMACVVLYAQSTSDQDRRFFSAVMVLEEATRVIEVGLLMFLFLFSTAFGLHWRQCVFGMALGLGIFTTAELVGITMRNFWGPSFHNSFAVVRAIAFNASLLLWAAYLLVPEKQASTTDSMSHGHLEQWNQALTEFIYQ
ncbi:MAG TPA: hypothetical protein VHA33_26610 [Candidatus Angelobacter sp.]|nr:hypothetical protein [Candidatus Angelobacter sp.]